MRGQDEVLKMGGGAEDCRLRRGGRSALGFSERGGGGAL